MKKLTVLLLLILLSLALSGPPLAAGVLPQSLAEPVGGITPMFVYIDNVNTSLSISYPDLATCTASIRCNSSSIDKIVIYMYFQTYSNGTWSNVGNWSQTYYSSSATMVRMPYAPQGYTYRVKASYYVYTGGQIEHVVNYSNTVIH